MPDIILAIHEGTGEIKPCFTMQSSQDRSKNMTKDTRLVYSTDPALNIKCPKCKELQSECTCEAEVDLKNFKFIALLRLEKQSRGGKTVTVIDRLPKSELFLKNLTTLLKKKCGAGGTYLTDGKDGVIEIQGDKREMIRKVLTAEGINSKG